MLERRRGVDGLDHSAFGGDTYNTAVYLARRTPVPVGYHTVIGSDPLSDSFLQATREAGLDTSLVTRHEHRTMGSYVIETDARGERSFTYFRDASAARTLLVDTPARVGRALTGASLIYFSGITLSLLSPDACENFAEHLDAARRAGAQVAFDTNYRPNGWHGRDAGAVIGAFLELVDIALPTLADDALLLGRDLDPQECAEVYLAAGASEVAVKLGDQGSVLFTPDGMTAVPAVRVTNVVDTTAAGDSFNGTYLAERLAGRAPAVAAGEASAVAARVIQQPGAIVAT